MRAATAIAVAAERRRDAAARLTGTEHGYLTVEGLAAEQDGRGLILACRCLCGVKTEVRKCELLRKERPVQSCGCLIAESNDGHYEPTNCRWATPLQQASNRRKAVPQ